jgi:hypothetical protein
MALLPSSFSAAASSSPAAKKPVSSIPVHNSSHGPVVPPARPPKSIPFHDGSHGPVVPPAPKSIPFHDGSWTCCYPTRSTILPAQQHPVSSTGLGPVVIHPHPPPPSAESFENLPITLNRKGGVYF